MQNFEYETEKEHEIASAQAAIDLWKGDVFAGLMGLERIQNEVSPLAADFTAPSSTYITALIIEAAELMQETDWKPWKPGKSVDVNRVADEFADILAFLGIIMIKFREEYGITPLQLAAAYAHKSKINIERFTATGP